MKNRLDWSSQTYNRCKSFIIKTYQCYASSFSHCIFEVIVCNAMFIFFTDNKTTQWEDPRLKKLGGPVSIYYIKY